MRLYLTPSLLVLLYSLTWPATNGLLTCHNGGTFDDVRYECICTPNYYGSFCETAFSLSDPCANWSSVPVLRDEHAVHRLGNNVTCGESLDQPCVDFSVIHAGWYRLVSPAGGELIIGTPTGNVACGSKMPYFLLNQTVQQEDNANRILSRARAYRYRPGFSGGYLPDDTSYPVRILKCFSALTLYYLQPLPSSQSHYCIGNKQLCAIGLTSVDGTGFEPCIGAECLPQLMNNVASPQLRLDDEYQGNGRYRSFFRCNVFAAFHINASQANGVLYRVEYELTLKNGTSIEIFRPCRWENESIRFGENRTFECRSDFVLTSQINVYGGSLICRARARCANAAARYNSMSVVSNVHGFFFRHWFQGGSDIIKPGTPATLCIDSKNIPVLEEVTFSISVGRQQIMVTDRIDVSVVRRDGNESLNCGFKMMNGRTNVTSICQDMVLQNHDPDNNIPLGLAEGDQISVVKINISFSSNSDGLFTRLSNGSMFTQKIQSIDMKVDLSRLQSNVTTFLHLYTDPVVKPATSAYTSEATFKIVDGYYTLLSHKYLPYEIQVKVDEFNGWWYVSEIAIRYFYYVIRIHGSSVHGNILAPTVTHHPPASRVLDAAKLTLPIQTDGLPIGVTVENVGYAMKVRFDLYGTILYIWGFTTGSSKECVSDFVMRTANLREESSCKKTFKDVGNGRIALDVMVVPGFYDTPKFVEGLLYGLNRSAISQPAKNLFLPQYEMPAIRSYRNRMQPTEVLSICSCDTTRVTTSSCFVDTTGKVKSRGKRQAKAIPLLTEAAPVRKIQARKISEQEADEFCNTFVQLQLSKSVSTEICSQTKDPTGQADYISQFKVICAQYAFRLGTFDSTQPLFNSMLGLCYTEMTYNATVVLGNSSKIEALVEDLCPGNCSSRGECLSGECKCAEGFWGTSCEFDIARRDEMPIEIQLLQRNIFCSSDNCPAAYLSVKPLLRSVDSVCNMKVNSSFNYTAPSVYISGDIVKCDLNAQHLWLVQEVRMFALLQISVTASDWESNNAVDLLLHQAHCDGKPVTCSADSLTCKIVGVLPVVGDEGNVCLPTVPKHATRLKTARQLTLMTLALLVLELSLK